MDTKNRKELLKITQGYHPSLMKSLWQITNTFIPYCILCLLSFVVFKFSILLSIPFSIVLSLFIVRIFCIQHDCGHGSFFNSKNANNLCGIFCSFITLFPYHQWRYNHAQHHIEFGKLEKKGAAEFYVLTVAEYLKLDNFRKFKYRVIRHPICIFFLAPIVVMLLNIIPFLAEPVFRHKMTSAVLTSVFNVSLYLLISHCVGYFFIVVYLPSVYLALIFGVWLFYIQHNFQGSYLRTEKEWNFADASLIGSSYCAMPKVLQWFTANIGFHHIHHLNPSIPNYNLPLCHQNNALFNTIKPLRLLDSWKALFANLWHTEQCKMISFDQIDH